MEGGSREWFFLVIFLQWAAHRTYSTTGSTQNFANTTTITNQFHALNRTHLK